MFVADRVVPKYLVHSYTLGVGSHITRYNLVSLLLLLLSTNVHKQNLMILAHSAAFMVFVVMMLLWLLMGSPAKVCGQIIQSR